MSALTVAPVVMLTELRVDAERSTALLELAQQELVEHAAFAQTLGRALYVSPRRDAVLAVDGYVNRVAALDTVGTLRSSRFRELSASLLGREQRCTLLDMDCVVKQSAESTPAALLQVRYIEVPPRVLAAYRAWREETIFRHVRGREEVASFSAYYTTLSHCPGVYFLSEAAGDRDRYVASFATPAYKKIIEEAAGRFIADGEAGLRTSEWLRVHAEAR